MLKFTVYNWMYSYQIETLIIKCLWSLVGVIWYYGVCDAGVCCAGCAMRARTVCCRKTTKNTIGVVNFKSKFLGEDSRTTLCEEVPLRHSLLVVPHIDKGIKQL